MGIFKTGIKVLLFWSTTAKKDGKNRKCCPKLDKLDLISCFLKTKNVQKGEITNNVLAAVL